MRKILVVIGLMFFSTVAFAESHSFKCEGGYAVKYLSGKNPSLEIYKNGKKIAMSNRNQKWADMVSITTDFDNNDVINYTVIKGYDGTDESFSVADYYTLITDNLIASMSLPEVRKNMKTALRVQLSGSMSDSTIYSCSVEK
ncbi:hypothetical protein [Scandinavium manionii]|uniref:hypothetical protein n=1 Tax=Scandinavium manionii TaxID=2926520 RepID=UPI0021657EF4|nr:hypothetical protein [Scandinavium manionii]MCS2148260.1 hypothetical protein [Scandinavium manionii]